LAALAAVLGKFVFFQLLDEPFFPSQPWLKDQRFAKWNHFCVTIVAAHGVGSTL